MNYAVFHSVLFLVKKGGCVINKVNDYLKQIVCIQKISSGCFCNKCIFCRKIISNNYNDWVWLDASDGTFSKSKILEVQNRFMISGLESCQKKFFLINNFDLCNLQVYNSLLNFIENFEQNIYFIFIAKNSKIIPETILSRCQIINIFCDDEKWKEMKENFQLSDNDIEDLKLIYWTFDESVKFVNNGEFTKIKKICADMLNAKNLTNLYNSLEAFKKMTYDNIKRIIVYLMNQEGLREKYLDLANLVALLKYNPSRISIFDKILKCLGNA